MKKKNSVFAVMMCVCMVFLPFFTSCSAKNSQASDYRPMTILTPIPEEDESVDLSEGKEPTAQQMEICKQVWDNVKKTYQTEKEMPKIVVMPNSFFKGDSASLIITAIYFSDTNTIAIPEGFDQTCKSYFCHELIHYLSDNDVDSDFQGMEYSLSNNSESYAFGVSLNEGLANYFSTKLYLHPEGFSIYEFETHIVAEIVAVYGEEKLWNAYTSGNYEELKNDFNAKVAKYYKTRKVEDVDLTPFEILQTTLDDYQYVTFHFDECFDYYGIEETVKHWSEDMNTIEIMMLNYATESGKRSDVQNEMKKLLENSTLDLQFADLSRIKYYSTEPCQQ
ncbi:MAG: hypothetical protein IJH12_08675 [Clostridia bacterium]|nr:hypothetical protein [Clostridia bacterium]